ncbi:DUF4870 domain-containing protein [Arthrospiribacter ruber]|uniref:Chloroplast import component protein (Tic20) n=1 Tax=Arthrospiribacter ruber TaxID=2487934 RepID=A0A951IR68_9BACT|nr:hypothetical protein [Arthrospiribacter ruber]MBW3466455.1 hypothetical protein [Arthrospiribacter ruber]
MMTSNPEVEGKQIGVIAYLTVIGLIAAFILNMDKKYPFAQFHIRQMLGLFVTGLALSFVSWVPFVGWLLAIVGFFLMIYMWIIGLLAAINGEMKPLPVLGDKYEEWFKNL